MTALLQLTSHVLFSGGHRASSCNAAATMSAVAPVIQRVSGVVGPRSALQSQLRIRLAVKALPLRGHARPLVASGEWKGVG